MAWCSIIISLLPLHAFCAPVKFTHRPPGRWDEAILLQRRAKETKLKSFGVSWLFEHMKPPEPDEISIPFNRTDILDKIPKEQALFDDVNPHDPDRGIVLLAERAARAFEDSIASSISRNGSANIERVAEQVLRHSDRELRDLDAVMDAQLLQEARSFIESKQGPMTHADSWGIKEWYTRWVLHTCIGGDVGLFFCHRVSFKLSLMPFFGSIPRDEHILKQREFWVGWTWTTGDWALLSLYTAWKSRKDSEDLLFDFERSQGTSPVYCIGAQANKTRRASYRAVHTPKVFDNFITVTLSMQHDGPHLGWKTFNAGPTFKNAWNWRCRMNECGQFMKWRSYPFWIEFFGGPLFSSPWFYAELSFGQWKPITELFGNNIGFCINTEWEHEFPYNMWKSLFNESLRNFW